MGFHAERSSLFQKIFIFKLLELSKIILFQLKCCGIDASNDWTNGGRKLPDSCCFELNEPCNTSNAYKLGCKSELFTFFKSNSTLIVSILFGITVVQVE